MKAFHCSVSLQSCWHTCTCTAAYLYIHVYTYRGCMCKRPFCHLLEPYIWSSTRLPDKNIHCRLVLNVRRPNHRLDTTSTHGQLLANEGKVKYSYMYCEWRPHSACAHVTLSHFYKLFKLEIWDKFKIIGFRFELELKTLTTSHGHIHVHGPVANRGKNIPRQLVLKYDSIMDIIYMCTSRNQEKTQRSWVSGSKLKCRYTCNFNSTQSCPSCVASTVHIASDLYQKSIFANESHSQLQERNDSHHP